MRFLSLALAALVSGMTVALIEVGINHWLDLHDLLWFAMWLMPEALIVAWVSAWFADRTEGWSPRLRLPLGAVLGVAIGGVGILIAAGSLGPWIGAFGFNTPRCFLVAGLAGMFAPLVRGQRSA